MTDPRQTDIALSVDEVSELFSSIAKAMRAFALYLPNNPIYQRAIEQVRAQFAPVWEATDELVLDVRETALVWGEEVVYSRDQKAESLAWTLYKDGVRSLSLLKGVERDEIVSFLETIVQARTLSAEAEDDLLTLLWEREFERIRYSYTDLLAEGVDPLEPEGAGPEAPPEEVTQAVQEEVRPGLPGVISLEDFDSTLYFLEENEIERLRDEITREYQLDLRQNVLAVLFDLIEVQEDEEVRSEIVGIVSRFLPYFLGGGDYRSVGYLLREAKAVLDRVRSLNPQHRLTLRDLPVQLSHPEAIEQLLQAIDGAMAPPSAEELGQLFAEIRPEALPVLLSWLVQLSTAQVREVVEKAAERLAEQQPAALASAITGAEPGVAELGARLAGRLRLAGAVGALGQQLQRDDLTVRLAAAEALAAIATPGALQALVAAVGDGSRDVRIVAVRALGSKRFRNGLSAVEGAVEGRGLRDWDLTEKMAVFEAYALIGGAAVVPRLEPMLSTRGLFRKRHDPETRACAALALGKVGTQEARKALERAAADKEILVRNAVAQALRGGEE